MIGELIPTGVTFGTGRQSINDMFSVTAEFNNIILDSSADFSGGTGGGIIYSGGTDLYNIFGTGGGVTTAGNGLTKTGDNITLGGAITGNTHIDLGVFGLHFGVDTSELQIRSTISGSQLFFSGNTTGITQVVVSTLGDGGSMGIRGKTDTLYPRYGKPGDMFLYSGNDANGLNFISQPGTGTDDFVRFFVGQALGASGTPDLYIHGSGVTRGYVGFNTGAPQYQVDINGDINTSGVIYSGGTDLYAIFSGGGGGGVSGTGTTNTITMWGGTSALTNSNIIQSGGGIELNDNAIVNGQFIVTGVTTFYSSETFRRKSTQDLGTTGGTVVWDMGNGSNSKVILNANMTLNISNVEDGDFGTLKITQDGTGSRTITLGTGTHQVVNGGNGSITLTSNVNAVDIVSFFYDGTEFYWTVGNDYT